MRRNEYEYEFIKDSMEKKSIARGARNTRTHCGKSGSVKFPSDFLTKKEIKAMSGEVVKYSSLKKPMTFDDFKTLPQDLKKEYITNIRDRFGAPDKYIAEMLGISSNYFSLYVRDFGLGAGKTAGNGNRKWNKEPFYAWRAGVDENAVCVPVEEEIDISDSENGDFVEKSSAVPVDGKLTFTCPADQALNMIGSILGTTNVRLEVKWTVAEHVDTRDCTIGNLDISRYMSCTTPMMGSTGTCGEG